MIRPVEMQMIIPQANQVGMQQHNVNQHAAIQSAQGTTELEKEVQQNSETVIPKDNADMMDFGYDAREKGSNTYDDFYAKRRKKRQEESENSGDNTKDHNKNSGETWVNFNVQV